jgi:hypothetical protein
MEMEMEVEVEVEVGLRIGWMGLRTDPLCFFPTV